MLPRTAIFDRLDWCQAGGASLRKSGGNTRGNTPIAALAAIVVLASPAWAQSSAPSAAPTQASPQAPQTPTPARAPMTAPVMCDQYLPPGVGIPSPAQATLFSFRLGLDGDFHDLAVYRSSGNRDLDKAALACASTVYQTKPVTHAGNPIEINWIGAISWDRHWHTYVEPNPSGAPNNCTSVGYPSSAIRDGIQGDALVSYVIATDGSVKNLAIARSAGDRSLDQASLQCIFKHHYFPVTHDGSPIEIDKQSEVRWYLHS